MLGPGRYSQWRSRFLRKLEGRPAVQQHTAIETVLNMTPENKEHFQSEKEAIFLLLTGIGDEIYSTIGLWELCKGCRKPKRVKDYAYHKEKMMMCKQAEQGGSLVKNPVYTGQPLEHVQNHDESNVYDNVRRHSEPTESINDTLRLEGRMIAWSSDSSNICTNDNQVDQNAAECVDERVALANLIANLTLDTEENKTILKQLKKANTSLTQELEKCKTNLDEL
ncbi:hypothetical protein Tco_0952930 [Tanacetum coccineum]|uniref:Uncharacterized protein n=1 Tax=Tanacetum coccineum TaxID=301880 RepID=A0ABQ5DYQ3_9ASTR